MVGVRIVLFRKLMYFDHFFFLRLYLKFFHKLPKYFSFKLNFFTIGSFCKHYFWLLMCMSLVFCAILCEIWHHLCFDGTAQNLDDGVSRITGSRHEGTSSSCSNGNSSSGFYSSASCKEQVGIQICGSSQKVFFVRGRCLSAHLKWECH